ncbi:MAG: MiaB/RimO family radical SAM methylthiotransferase [Candidatus Omnitrophica bacterium]|nr:MiaB/RimO family radical SAM methylthiotransferase [Candidatus Omnitrophota bacterium]
MAKNTFSIVSLGCFRNTYDSEVVAKKLSLEGYAIKQDAVSCGVLAINTCGFIDKAKQESVHAIRDAVKLKKQGKIKRLIVFGCLVQRYKKELQDAFPEVDQWQGVQGFTKKASKRIKLFPSHVEFVKISEGCRNNCSYCAIPIIKGSLKSRPQQEIINEIRTLNGKGVKELNLIGQDITSWGKDLSAKAGLTDLLKKIIKTADMPWIRLLYTHPKHLQDSLIELIASEKRICKYIDLPIQHINDRLLKLMNRRTARAQIKRLISKIRRKIPNCFLRTSVIVGFPGETEAEFKELLEFIKDVRFERLGAFAYSREEGTAAYSFSDQVHYRRKNRRYNEIMRCQQNIADSVNSQFLGKEIDVLIEEKEKDVFVGRTQYDAYEVDGEVFIKMKDLKIGTFHKTRITDVYGYDLIGGPTE